MAAEYVESPPVVGSAFTLALPNPYKNAVAWPTLGSLTVTVYVFLPSGTQIAGSPFTSSYDSGVPEFTKDILYTLVTEAGTWVAVWKLVAAGVPVKSIDQEFEVMASSVPIGS